MLGYKYCDNGVFEILGFGTWAMGNGEWDMGGLCWDGKAQGGRREAESTGSLPVYSSFDTLSGVSTRGVLGIPYGDMDICGVERDG